jgi:hypothetical protein
MRGPSCSRALRFALDAATGREEIVDALCSGDPRLDVVERAS